MVGLTARQSASGDLEHQALSRQDPEEAPLNMTTVASAGPQLISTQDNGSNKAHFISMQVCLSGVKLLPSLLPTYVLYIAVKPVNNEWRRGPESFSPGDLDTPDISSPKPRDKHLKPVGRFTSDFLGICP